MNAWWGTFDLAVAFYSGKPADPPANDFITRNSGDAEMIEVAGGPATQVRGSRVLALCPPGTDGVSEADLSPAAARWDAEPGEFILDWDDVRGSADPQADVLAFLHSGSARPAKHAAGMPFWPAARRATLHRS